MSREGGGEARSVSAPYAALLRPELAELTAYAPEPSPGLLKLDDNVAPDLLGAGARARLGEALAQTELRSYPDARATELREAIAARCGAASAAEVLVGCGSDEVIAILLTALSRPRPKAPSSTILTVAPTFTMYRQSARGRGQRVMEVPLDQGWDLAVDSMKRGIEIGRPNLVFIASPNNPTGGMVAPERLEAVVDAAPEAIVVIDEAYIDYASRDQLHLRARPNVVIMRTLSKIGLAALRVGWLLAPTPLIAELEKIRQPFNLPAPSQRAAIVALRELGGELESLATNVRAERERTAGALRATGYEPAPSEANFLWVKTPRPAEETTRRLRDRGILVRSFHAQGGRMRDRIRITVGAPADNDRLIEALRDSS